MRDIPYVSRDQMQEIDDLMIDKYGIGVSKMMEIAGYQISRFISQNFENSKEVLFCVGKGNNGGDALCASRYLNSLGYDSNIMLSSPDIKGVSSDQLEIVRNISSINEYDGFGDISEPHVVVDGLLGYNIEGDPYGSIAQMIKEINGLDSKIVSIDLPSGLDPDSGKKYSPCINADYTISLSFPKKGVKDSDCAGKVYVADMGVVPEINKMVSSDPNPFSDEPIIEM